MNNFMFNIKQLKMKKFIKYIWQLIISTSNAALEIPSLRPCPVTAFYYLIASRRVTYLAPQQLFNLTWFFFWTKYYFDFLLMYFSIDTISIVNSSNNKIIIVNQFFCKWNYHLWSSCSIDVIYVYFLLTFTFKRFFGNKSRIGFSCFLVIKNWKASAYFYFDRQLFFFYFWKFFPEKNM